jgi:hypothetical protein
MQSLSPQYSTHSHQSHIAPPRRSRNILQQHHTLSAIHTIHDVEHRHGPHSPINVPSSLCLFDFPLRRRLLLPAVAVGAAVGTIRGLHLRLGDGAAVVFLAARVPEDHGAQQDKGHEDDGVVHGLAVGGQGSGEEEDDGHEQRPQAGPHVDKVAGLAHVPGPRLEPVEGELAQDGDAVRPVERDGGDVEHALDGNVVAQTDEVDGDAPEYGDPHGVEGRAGAPVDLCPDVAHGQELVAGEGPDGAGESLRGREAHELQDDEGEDGEGDAAAAAERVVEDLGDGLLDGGLEDRGRVAHAEAEDNVEEEAGDVGECHGEGDGPGSLSLWFVDSVKLSADIMSGDATEKKGSGGVEGPGPAYSSVM